MENIYKKGLFKFFIFFLIYSVNTYSQTYITWNAAGFGSTGVSGSFTDGGVSGAVNTTLGTIGFPITFVSPASTQSNLIVAGNNTFSTMGPNQNDPSRSLTFNFSTPVIVTRFNMTDIDRSPGTGSGWDDSFNFGNILFTNTTNVNCNATVNGATATTDVGGGLEFASWLCSTGPVNTFTLNYSTTNGNTHAYLGYSMQVLVPPTIAPLCLNETPPSLPLTIGNGISGTWSPSTINTNSPGVFNYTFIPNQSQSISCPITISVTVTNDNCCIPNLTLENMFDDVSNTTTPTYLTLRQTSDWVKARNFILEGNHNAGVGVVYTADNFIELLPGVGSDPGFEAEFGSQFSAYPKECPNGFVYKSSNKSENLVLQDNFTLDDLPKCYSLSKEQNSSIFNINMINIGLNGVLLYSLDGKCVLEKNFKNSDSYLLDLNGFNSGIYLLNIKTSDGRIVSEKIILE